MDAVTESDQTMIVASTQTDLITSDILWQCLFVIKKEFVNLDYRITRGQKGQEMVVVYRSDAFGIFGPPVDPITLTLDPSGQSLLSILFKPVQRVSFVSPKTGCIEVNTLLKLLLLVAGKGFYFCPGIPENFLIGKTFNRNVMLHKLPFKRYQSTNCPVYYQCSETVIKNSKASCIAICQRCLQAAAAMGQPHSSQNYANSTKADIPNKTIYVAVTEDNNGLCPRETVPPHSGFQVLTPLSSNLKQDIKRVTSGELHNNYSKLSPVDSNGLSGVASAENKSDALIDKIKSGTSSLRLMLREKYKKKTLGFPDESLQDIKSESVNNKMEKKSKCNVCKQCKKQFSTPASLLNHLQRHEGLPGSWKDRLRSKRQDTIGTKTSSLLRMIARSSKPQAGPKNKKNSPAISENALRMVLKYLDVIIPSMNGARTVKKEQTKSNSKPSSKQSSNSVPAASDDVNRPSNGLAAVQTLLEAAALTGSGLDDMKRTNLDGPGRKRKAVAAVLPVPQSSSSEDGWAKKSRKSMRLATKKSKGKLSDLKDTQMDNSPSSHDTALLRNLDLLSSVSLNLHVPPTNVTTAHVTSYAPVSPHGSASVFVSSSTVHPVPHSYNVTVSNHVQHNTSGGKVVCSKTSDALVDSSGAKLPPVPPLLFAGLGHEQSVLFNGSDVQKPFGSSSADLPVAGCPSILRSLVSVSDASSSDCGAIDLSKPKQMGLSPNIPQEMQIGALPRLSDNLVPVGKEDQKELLKCIMMMSKAAPIAPAQPPESVISDKQSDCNLQARMFASARDYKIDRKSNNSVSQVQSVVASSASRIVQGVKCGKGGGPGAPVQGDEIQCGYKWSGSGGLVKERTQMVRELVPADIMDSLLNRSIPQISPMSNAQSSAINLSSPPLPQHPHHILSNACSPVRNSPPTISALNLTTAKPNHIPSPKRAGPGRPKKSATTSYPPSPPSIWPPAPNTRSILRSSLMHPPRAHTPTDRGTNSGSSPQKTVHLPNNCAPSPNSLASSVSSNGAVSSPSLSAMLRHPSSIKKDLTYDYTGSGYFSIDPMALHGNNTTAFSKGVEIKSEPMDNFLHGSHDRIIMALPVKNEVSEQHRGSQLIIDDDDSSSKNLVMEIR
ncbi:uncharacterized protein LOC106057514 [Biomphalaria glabrata]|uniref:Uncharacterized protein LOC106057514 n=1 Tax=Biomphalaria glabrata TaxID=6526 RepID=A0A9U8E3I0_BIOGL|nr:uncharacterized protein LOC106057514 [Biomphalaria glabrata]XP_055888016.1 uncharacterized protein LOC106057514 [Biomphalaria glabrata]XP_055888017.1 uncharacterized protein LOC106057514 [Biomphalaria glabrata]XP_055888019.1 uncharacterized protein LOC106057514 [Biomphalaria glabrata]